MFVEKGGSNGLGPTFEEEVVVINGKLIEDCCMLLVLDCGWAVSREKLNFCEALVTLAVLFSDITVGKTEERTVLEGAASSGLLVNNAKFDRTAEDCIVLVEVLVT